MKLQDYLDDQIQRPYEAGVWDCSKFVLMWVTQTAPKAARAAVIELVKDGYNDIRRGNEQDFDAVRETMGVKTPEEFVAYFHNLAPDYIKLPSRPQPGDIVVRQEGLACGIVDSDFQGIFLSKPRGYIKHAVGANDAFMRAVE